MGFQKLHDVSCTRIRFREGHSRCGLVFVFHKGRRILVESPTTSPNAPPTLRIANTASPRFPIVVRSREALLLILVREKKEA